MFYDDVFAVFGPIDDQQDQVAAVLNSKSLEPKSMIQQAFRCAMTTRPHIQSAITESQFYDFAYFSGFANGGALPTRDPILGEGRLAPGWTHSEGNSTATRTPTPERAGDVGGPGGGPFPPRPRLFRQLGRDELRRVFDVCVRHQGVMHDQAFALAVAHMHLLRHIADAGRIPEIGSKSLRMTLSEAADHLSAYVSQRVQPFPFPVEYYTKVSTPMKTMWQYSEGLERFYRQYSTKDVFSWKCCESFAVDVGIVPQLSPQTMERIFQQTLERHEDTAASTAADGGAPAYASYAARTASKNNSGITMDGFFELIARVAGSLYADDVFSKRITLEAKLEHLITTVLGAAYANLYGGPLPKEDGDVPHPFVTKVVPAEVDETCTSVVFHGEYFGALGRGLFVASSLSQTPVQITQKQVLENLDEIDGVEVPLRYDQTIVWDECLVISPLPRIWNFIFKHHVTFIIGNTPEDVLHRAEPQQNLVNLVHKPMVVQLSSATLESLEAVFLDGCSQLAYNKGHMYDFCWEFVSTQYQISQMVSISNACALGIEMEQFRSVIGSVSVSGILMALFRKYAVSRDNGTTAKPASLPGSLSESTPFATAPPPEATSPATRPSLTLSTFTEIICRMAMATGCEADAADEIITDMLKPASVLHKAAGAGSSQGRRGTNPSVSKGDDVSDPLSAGPRRGSMGTFLGGERRNSEFGVFGEESSSMSVGDYGSFRGRSKSIKDNESIMRTVATDQRLVRVLKQNNSDLKAKLASLEQKKQLWDITRGEVQSTMAQLRGLLEIVLPPETRDGGVHIASKLAVVYRKQLLDICHSVGDVMEREDATSGDGDAVKHMIQQQLDAFAAAEQRALTAGAGSNQKGNRLQAQLAMMAKQGASPTPDSAELEEMREEKAKLERSLAEQEERVTDLRELLQRAHADSTKFKEEASWLRSVMTQQKAQHQGELTKLRVTVSEKTEQVKALETERTRMDKTLSSMEQQVHQKKLEISRLEFLHQQQETSIENLSTKLSDTISKSVHGTTSYGSDAIDHREPSAAAESSESSQPAQHAGGGRRRSSSAATGNKWASKKLQTAGATVNTSALLIRELESLRSKEKDFLKNRSAAIVEQLEQESTAHKETQQALQESKGRNAVLRGELEKLISLLKEVGRMTALQLQASCSGAGEVPSSGQDADELAAALSSAAALLSADSNGQGEEAGIYLSAQHQGYIPGVTPESTPGTSSLKPSAMSRVAIQMEILKAIQSTIGSSAKLVAEDQEAAERDDMRLRKRQADAERERQQLRDEDAEYIGDGSFEANMPMQMLRESGARPHVTTFVEATPNRSGVGSAPHPPPPKSGSARHWASAVNKATAVATLQRIGSTKRAQNSLDESRDPGSATGGSDGPPLESIQSGSPLTRNQSGLGDGIRTVGSMRTTSSGAFSRVASTITKGRSFARHASNRGMSPARSGDDTSIPQHQHQQQHQHAYHRAAPTVPRCTNCRNMRSILEAHHSYTKKCLAILRGDLDTLRVRVAIDLREGYDGVRERSELILRAVEFAPQILQNALLSPAPRSSSSGGQRSGAPSRNLSRCVSPTMASAAGGVHQQSFPRVVPNAMALGTEICVPSAPGGRGALTSPTDGDTSGTRLERLAKALSALSSATGFANGEDRRGLDRDNAPWRSNETLISQIPPTSALSLLKGVHLHRGCTPDDATISMGKHWVKDDDTDLPPSPFIVREHGGGGRTVLVIDQRLTHKTDPSNVYVGAAPVLGEDEQEAVDRGRLMTGPTLMTRLAHASAMADNPRGGAAAAELEGAVRYKVLVRDKNTGDVTAVDAEGPPPSRQSGRGANTLPVIPSPRTPRGRQTLLNDALALTDLDNGTDDSGEPRNRMSDMVMELLMDAGLRSGRLLCRSTPCGSRPHLCPTALSSTAGPTPLPQRPTVTSPMVAQPSRLGTASDAAKSQLTCRPSGMRNTAVAPPLSANAIKLNHVRKLISDERSNV